MKARVLVVLALAAAAFALAPVAQSRQAANPVLNVAFSATGAISVALGDGTPVGTTSGSPTVIPGGYYTVNEVGPGGCSVMPHWQVNGPGIQISDNLTEGEVGNETYAIVLQPNSTYTWRSDAAPSVIHTFATNATMAGTPPPTGPIQSSKHTVGSSTSLIGSSAVRGSLAGAVSAAGKLTLQPAKVAPGRYVITVVDASKKVGFTLRDGSKTVTVTTPAFVGKHSRTITLTTGRWLVGSSVLVVR